MYFLLSIYTVKMDDIAVPEKYKIGEKTTPKSEPKLYNGNNIIII